LDHPPSANAYRRRERCSACNQPGWRYFQNLSLGYGDGAVGLPYAELRTLLEQAVAGMDDGNGTLPGITLLAENQTLIVKSLPEQHESIIEII